MQARKRAQSMYVEPTHPGVGDEEEEYENQGRPMSQIYPPVGQTLQAREEPAVTVSTSRDSPAEEYTSQQAEAQGNELNGLALEVPDARFLGAKKISQARSVEILHNESLSNGVLEASESSDTASSGREEISRAQGGGKMEFNIQTQMSPHTLRDLADLLEKLQSSDRTRDITVNINILHG